jgi:16S rRNA processing protein RimM
MNEDLVAIAKLIKTRGLRGEIAADILTDFPERFENLKDVTAVKPDGGQQNLQIESFWFQKNRIILKFAGFDSIEAAEKLVNHEICVRENEAVELDEDEFFDWELQGCAVETSTGEKIGTVRELMRTGGTEILVVDSLADNKKDFLIPFAEKICVGVDVENKLITVDLPDGLLEF